MALSTSRSIILTGCDVSPTRSCTARKGRKVRRRKLNLSNTCSELSTKLKTGIARHNWKSFQVRKCTSMLSGSKDQGALALNLYLK